jgi:hypothetical protein
MIIDNFTGNPYFLIWDPLCSTGRETHRSFACKEGQAELASTAKFQRLIIASLHRGHKYENIETVKQELSAKVMELAPDGVTNEKLVRET